jgi:hypothetical protein
MRGEIAAIQLLHALLAQLSQEPDITPKAAAK